jgi:hypothetical protein
MATWPDIEVERVLICGPRDFNFYMPVYNIVLSLRQYYGSGLTIIEGMATGVDKSAGRAAIMLGLKLKEYPADWRMGARAGPVRNREMHDKGRPHLVTAIGYGKGTADMVSFSRSQGTPVVWRYLWWRGRFAS